MTDNHLPLGNVSFLCTIHTKSRRTCKHEAHVPFKKPFCRKIVKRNRFDTGFCPKLPRSGVIRRPLLAGAPWLRISDTICLSANIGPVLLFVKMCFWPYETVFKTPGVQISTEKVGAISDRETSPKTNWNFKPQCPKCVKTKSQN